jgi:uncharacterized repeat protein (TIGR03847 family)
MERQVFAYDPPERFVAGTVGEPGSRAFYLQARSGARVTSVLLEKQQVAALAERVDEVLDEVLRRSGGTAAPAVAPSALADNAPLDQPLLEEFRVVALALAWDGDDERLVIEAHGPAAGEDEAAGGRTGPTSADQPAPQPPAAESADTGEGDGLDDGTAVETGDVLRVRLTAAMARAFAQRALAVVSAGRPPCPFCGLPLDAAGHVCPRQNGYRRR